MRKSNILQQLEAATKALTSTAASATEVDWVRVANAVEALRSEAASVTVESADGPLASAVRSIRNRVVRAGVEGCSRRELQAAVAGQHRKLLGFAVILETAEAGGVVEMLSPGRWFAA